MGRPLAPLVPLASAPDSVLSWLSSWDFEPQLFWSAAVPAVSPDGATQVKPPSDCRWVWLCRKIRYGSTPWLRKLLRMPSHSAAQHPLAPEQVSEPVRWQEVEHWLKVALPDVSSRKRATTGWLFTRR